MSTADERSALLLKRKKLNESLRRLRLEEAAKLKVPPMQVLQNSTLADIVVQMPKTKAELVGIRGVGLKKFELFGQTVLMAIEAYGKANGPQEEDLSSKDPAIPCDDKPSSAPSSPLREHVTQVIKPSPRLTYV